MFSLLHDRNSKRFSFLKHDRGDFLLEVLALAIICVYFETFQVIKIELLVCERYVYFCPSEGFPCIHQKLSKGRADIEEHGIIQ